MDKDTFDIGNDFKISGKRRKLKKFDIVKEYEDLNKLTQLNDYLITKKPIKIVLVISNFVKDVTVFKDKPDCKLSANDNKFCLKEIFANLQRRQIIFWLIYNKSIPRISLEFGKTQK